MFMAILAFTGFFYLNVISVLLTSGYITKVSAFGLSLMSNINWLYVNLGFYFSACVIIGILIREKNMTGLDKKYKSLHGWLMLLYFISSLFFFLFAVTHKPEEQTRIEGIFIEAPRLK
jgi:Mn2+/Fe2+ NRAMP family transporter